MTNVQILSDTCCDLTQEQLARFGIRTVPLYVSLGDKTCRDGVDIQPRDLFEYFDRTQQTPKTSAATVGDYIEFFRPFAEARRDAVYIGLSEKMSCTVANARLAAGQLAAEGLPGRVFCVDSMNLSTGIGLMVMRAGELAAEGRTAEEIVAAMDGMAGRVRASFVLDTLVYLHRGGRCSLLASVGASLLSLHPEIAVSNGSMASRAKYRGKTPVAVKKYVQNLLADRANIEDHRVFVTYSPGCDPAIVEAAVSEVRAAGFEEALESTAGSVISSHCGTNCIGFLFVVKA